MSRFKDTSDKIYVGFNKNDLQSYTGTSNADAELDCSNNSPIYNAINTEFNPALVPTFEKGDKITPNSPFYGPNGLSLQLTEKGNLYLNKYDIKKNDNNNGETITNTTLWSGAICAMGSELLTLGAGYGCDGNLDILFNGNNVLNPYCAFETNGNLTCYGCTIAGGTSVPYMTFDNRNNSGSKLIINGPYNINISDNNIIDLSGSITILNSNNDISYNSRFNTDLSNLRLQPYFDKADKCANAKAATELSSDYFAHLAGEQVYKDSNISYNIQYINAINLGVGIVATLIYIYILSKQK